MGYDEKKKKKKNHAEKLTVKVLLKEFSCSAQPEH